MNKELEYKLDTLLIDDDAKEVLRLSDKLLNSDLHVVRKSAPALLLIAGEGCGSTSYGKVYSEIVSSSLTLKVRCKEPFLELIFPKDDEEKEKLFFASPRRLAAIHNRYYGTMLISFKDFSGQDLIKSESLDRLIEFVAANKGNIHFVFHILPEFSAKNQLVGRVQEITNVTEVVLDSPTIDRGCSYVISELNRQGYSIEENTLSLLKEDVLPKIISNKSMGYRALDNFLERAFLEMSIHGDNKELDNSILMNLKCRYEKFEMLSNKENLKIGFR